MRVAEGPAKIVNGKVKLFVCTDGNDEDAVLDTHEVIAELHEATSKDKELQEEIRNWRFSMLGTNTQALGADYISELVEHGCKECNLGAASREAKGLPVERALAQTTPHPRQVEGRPEAAGAPPVASGAPDVAAAVCKRWMRGA